LRLKSHVFQVAQGSGNTFSQMQTTIGSCPFGHCHLKEKQEAIRLYF